jgi:Fic family protein
MDLAEILQRVDELKTEIDALRPIDREQELRILQKFRLDWNYHSNALEGNTLTYGETRAFLLHGVTAQGKPFRDYLDMKGHQAALEQLEEIVRQQQPLTEADIRELHKILLIESYDMPAVTFDGRPTTRRVAIGQYKTISNSVRTSTGAIHFYASPEETPARMGDLMAWYRQAVDADALHPLLIAATFHFRFVEIHPFDDGNGRMARLLMNLILMQAGYVPVIINTSTKGEYLLALETADAGDLEPFVTLIGSNLVQSLELFLRGARGEAIDELADFERKLTALQAKLNKTNQGDQP